MTKRIFLIIGREFIDENNYSIYVSYYDGNIPNGIDTEQDVIAANKYLQNK